MPMNKQQLDAYKVLKQRLSSTQKIIKMDLKSDRIPQPGDATSFITTSQEMERLSPNSWQSAMDAYMKRLVQFQAAMDGSDLSTIKDSFQKLLDCKISCHKAFRQK